MNATIEQEPVGYTYADLSKKDWVSVIFKMSQEPPRKGATFLYLAPPQAQSVKYALEQAAKIADITADKELTEYWAGYASAGKNIAKAIRALIQEDKYD